MAHYYVNDIAQPNGDHEVHKQGCEYMPMSKKDLGEHIHCYTAMVVATKAYYRQSNGCAFCSPECHTS